MTSTETGVLIDTGCEPIFWHLPEGRSSVYLPDSRKLWDEMWHRRREVLGFAHSHPGRGTPVPSGTDLTTFKAIEQALGCQLMWWICSEDELVTVRLRGGSYETSPCYGLHHSWLPQLRRLSYIEPTLATLQE
tara:strand:- start:46616 stop:47014 length:399 start_codon:yes stop_codon:yes gene_type:complete